MALPDYSTEKLSHTALVYRSTISRSNQIIYTTTLATIVALLVMLPIIKVPVSIKSTGVFQSSIEKTELIVPVNGRLIKYSLADNKKLKQGDTLLAIDAGLPKQQDALVESRKTQIRQFLADISNLLSFRGNSSSLQTGQYLASWQQYIQELGNAGIARRQAGNSFARYNKLYQNRVLTQAEYEKYKFELEQAESAYHMVQTKYKTQWQTEANNYRNEQRQLSGQQAELDEQKKQYVLRAPVNGSVQNLAGLQNGAYVFANQKIGEVSPDAGLVAYCYINPADIGLIRKGQEVYFQVNAYNYNQWGLAIGKVLDIADDIVVLNGNQPAFKVRCQINRDFLVLKNGYKGYLKKGMNFTARFKVTNRSLFQLLYDKVDDWVNPNVIEKA